MSQEVIEISIDVNGKATIDAKGFKGGSCKDATKIYESLYSERVSDVEKAEIHEGAPCHVVTVNA